MQPTNVGCLFKMENGNYIPESSLDSIVLGETSGLTTKTEKAEAIYNWICKSIQVEEVKGLRRILRRFRDCEDVLKDRTGNCCEQAWLYVNMARRIRLKAWYQDFDVDHQGCLERHACASVEIEEGEINVDTVFGQFNATYKKYNLKRRSNPIFYYNLRIFIDRLIIASVLASVCFLPLVFLKGSLYKKNHHPIRTPSKFSEWFSLGGKDKSLEEFFETENGEIIFKMSEESSSLMKEVILLKELRRDYRFSSSEVLNLYLMLDRNMDNKISVDEVSQYRNELRISYR